MNVQHWKDRIARFLGAQTISLMGSSIVQFAIIWHITVETSSGTMMMLATVCSFAPQILLSLFAGVLLDRYSRKYLIMIADTVIALTTLALFFVLRANDNNLTYLFIALAIRSAGTGVQSPAVNAVIPQLVPESVLMRINGLYASMYSFIAFLSPALAATVLSFAGLRAALLIDIATALIGVAITATISFPSLERTDQEAPSSLEGLKDGLNYLRGHTLLRRLLSYLAMTLFLLSPVFMISLISERSFGGEYWRLASMESSYGLGAIIGGAFIAWWGGMENRMTMSLIAAVGLGVLMVALGFASYWVFVILLFAWGLVGPLYDTPFVTLLQERVEPDMHGRVFGFLQVVIAASIPLGMMLFGPLADIVPIEYIYIVCGLLIIVLAAFARYGLKLEEI